MADQFVAIDISTTLCEPQKNVDKASLSPPCTVVSLEPFADNASFKVDQTSLNKLVSDKNIHQLRQFGGTPAVVAALGTNIHDGIIDSEEELARRKEAFGSNTYTKPPTRSFLDFVAKGFAIFILLGCAALSLGFGIKEHGMKDGWYDGGSIFLNVFVVIAVSVRKYRQKRRFDKLLKILSSDIRVEVIRKGRPQQISVSNIVVGDVIFLKTGVQIPADGLFLEGHALQVDESSVTGERDHVEVNSSQHPFLFSGIRVADGYAHMLATSVGMNTTWGQMMSQISRDTTGETPWQARLKKLTSSIEKVGLAVAFLVLVVLAVLKRKELPKIEELVSDIAQLVATAVTIIVVAIPEGLPFAVSLSLAYTIKRMMGDQAMVRKLFACVTLGSATTICTDKTGALTLNQMKVTQFWLGTEVTEPVSTGAASSISPWLVEIIQQGVALNTTGTVYRASSESEYEFSGSPTEKAILSWAVQELNIEMEKLKQSCDVALNIETFNSQKKRSGVLVRNNTDNTTHMHWKGAAEMILTMCSSYYDASGIKKQLDDSEREKFGQIIQDAAASSLRCIGFAHKQLSEEENDDADDQKKLQEDNFSLLGLVGIKDYQCRPGVKEAVEDCQHAGVNIKMITGDNVLTATAIATECGILKPNQDLSSGVVVEGEEFRNYTEEERMEKIDKICVMARSSPFDKLLMVQCLKQKGHVVAVTGDGTNDAPALHEADIGLCMGIQSSEVAKEKSDIVISDGNFSSLATVLLRGRCVYSNIQKFIQFQLTVNVAALVISFVAVVSAREVPSTAVLLLWANLSTGTLGALAVATQQPTKELMDKPPVGQTEPIVTNIMWRNLVAQAMCQIVVLLTLHFRGESMFGVNEKVKEALVYNTFVLCQVFNVFNARKLEKKNVFEGIHKKKLFLGIIGIIIVLQVVVMEILYKFANMERLNWGQWVLCFGVAAPSWLIGWLVKFIPVPHKPIFSYLNWKK